jgi:hypothetical protein
MVESASPSTNNPLYITMEYPNKWSSEGISNIKTIEVKIINGYREVYFDSYLVKRSPINYRPFGEAIDYRPCLGDKVFSICFDDINSISQSHYMLEPATITRTGACAIVPQGA